VPLKHVLEQFGLLLDSSHFFSSFCPPICFISCVIPRHDLHEPVRFLKILRAAAPDEFLKLSGLGFSLFFLHFLGRPQILRALA
jgi:hypothetical protein